MTDESLLKRIAYEYPYFEEYLEPHGALTIERECHACFYYGMLAHKARLMAGSGPESQTIVYKVGDTLPTWLTPRDAEIARSVALMYVLDSPEQFLRFKKNAWVQAKMLGVEIDPVVFEVTPDRKFN